MCDTQCQQPRLSTLATAPARQTAQSMLGLGQTTKELMSGRKIRPSLPKMSLQEVTSLYSQPPSRSTRKTE